MEMYSWVIKISESLKGPQRDRLRVDRAKGQDSSTPLDCDFPRAHSAL